MNRYLYTMRTKFTDYFGTHHDDWCFNTTEPDPEKALTLYKQWYKNKYTHWFTLVEVFAVRSKKIYY